MSDTKSYASPWSDRLVIIVFPALAFIVGMVVNTFTIVDKIATKPYVDTAISEQRKYTDEKAAQAIKDAIDHSDRNRGDMQIKLEQYSSDIKSQGVKIDLMLNMIGRPYAKPTR